MREDPTVECDADTLREMLTFVRLGGGAMGAAVGMHDDLVMALAIAHFILPEGGYAWTPVEGSAENPLARHFKLPERRGENETYMNWEDSE